MGSGTRLACLLCGCVSTGGVDLVRETFRPTVTLERTLEKLREGMEEPKFNATKIFKSMTKESGGLFCCSCLEVIHGGMPVAAEILRLEGTLKTFGGMIRNARTNYGAGERMQRSEASSCLDFSSGTVQPSNDEDKEELVCSDQDSDYPDSQEEGNIKAGNKGKGQEVSRRNRKSEMKRGPCKSSGKAGLMLSIKRAPGILNCPSCDFFVDVRSPKETKMSPDSFSNAVRVRLQDKSIIRMIPHFRSTHMPSEAATKFEVNNEGVKMFQCLECSYSKMRFSMIMRHYLRNHVYKQYSDMDRSTKRLSCPEKDCSYFVEATLTSIGLRGKNKSALHLREAFALHVLRQHDFPSSAFHNKSIKRLSSSLSVETKGKGKEFRCTRCDYSDRVPATATKSQYMSSRHKYLGHFYYSHIICKLQCD